MSTNQHYGAAHEAPALAPPPSHQGWKNFPIFEDCVEEDAQNAIEFSRNALTSGSDEMGITLTAKTVLRQYLTEKLLMNSPEMLRHRQRSRPQGKHPLLTPHDFVIDVELLAAGALKRKPTLLKAFVVLFREEYGERVNGFALTAPHLFDQMLRLLGARFKRRDVNITGLHSYIFLPSKSGGAR
jgi:hypothetical protein